MSWARRPTDVRGGHAPSFSLPVKAGILAVDHLQEGGLGRVSLICRAWQRIGDIGPGVGGALDQPRPVRVHREGGPRGTAATPSPWPMEFCFLRGCSSARHSGTGEPDRWRRATRRGVSVPGGRGSSPRETSAGTSTPARLIPGTFSAGNPTLLLQRGGKVWMHEPAFKHGRHRLLPRS